MLAHLTDTLTLLIQNFYISTGLLGIALAMAIESCCIPLPSEIVMPLAGIMLANGSILKGMNSVLGLFLIALAGAVGCLIGSLAAYAIGANGGRPLMLKYGRYVLISQHDADKADHFFQRWGSATAFFSRLLPVVRTYISLPAGITKMPLVTFSIYTLLGSLIWSILLAYVGTIVHANLAALTPIFHTFDAVIVVALVVLIVLYVWRHMRNDRKAREALAVQGGAGQPPTQGWSQSTDSSQAGQFRGPQSLPGWNQQPAPQGPPAWSQQPAQQQWNQQPMPQAPQGPQAWGQQPAQQQWNQQPTPQVPQDPQAWGQQPAQQQWNQQPTPQVPQDPSAWGQQPAQQQWNQQPVPPAPQGPPAWGQQPGQQPWGQQPVPQAPQGQAGGQQPAPQAWPPQPGR